MPTNKFLQVVAGFSASILVNSIILFPYFLFMYDYLPIYDGNSTSYLTMNVESAIYLLSMAIICLVFAKISKRHLIAISFWFVSLICVCFLYSIFPSIIWF